MPLKAFPLDLRGELKPQLLPCREAASDRRLLVELAADDCLIALRRFEDLPGTSEIIRCLTKTASTVMQMLA
jgi:hypothetical protein